MNEIQKAASILGKQNLGKKKNLTEEAKEACRKRLEENRKKRWPKNELG